MGGIVLGQLDNHTRYVRWARCWYFCLTNCIRRDLNQRFHIVQRLRARTDARAAAWRKSLPRELGNRLVTLIAREKASILWSANCSYSLTPEAKASIGALHAYISNTESPWEAPFGTIVQRVPHFESLGDASLLGGMPSARP